MVNFIFKLEFARVIVNLRYDAEKIIKGKIYNNFVGKTFGINVLTGV